MGNVFFAFLMSFSASALFAWAAYPLVKYSGGGYGAAFLLFAVFSGVFYAASRKILRLADEKGARKKRMIFPYVMFLIVGVLILRSDYFSEVSPSENRRLGPFPDVNPFHEKFPSRMDVYLSDRIAFREAALDAASKFPSTRPVKVENTAQAVAGKDDWLFYNDGNTAETAFDFMRISRFNDEQTALMYENVREAAEWFEKRGIKLYIMFPPIKHDIYPEYYVPHWKRLPFPNRYGQFREYAEGRGLPIVDLDEAVRRAKAKGPVYYKNDSHWNYSGGYAAYAELIKAVRADFPDLAYYSEEEIEWVSMPAIKPGDLVSFLRGYPAEFGPQIQPRPKKPVKFEVLEETPIEGTHLTGSNFVLKTDNPAGLRAFVVHDSYFDYIWPFLRRSFSVVQDKWVWGVSPLKYADEILKFEPDVVIWETHQRYVRELAKKDFNSKWILNR